MKRSWHQSSWGYFGFDAKSKSNKSKNKLWIYRKLKIFCTTKGKGQQNEKVIYGVGENICKLHFWQGLTFKILKEFIHLNSKSKPTNNLIKKWAEDMNRHFFFKEDIKQANRYMKRRTMLCHQKNANQTITG